MRLAGEGSRESLHVDEVAAVCVHLFLTLMWGVGVNIFLFGFLLLGAGAGETDHRRSLGEMFDRDRRLALLLRQGETEAAPHAAAGAAVADREPRQIKRKVESDDLSADGVARVVKNLVHEFGSRQHANALAVRARFLIGHELTEKHLFGFV